MRLPHADVRHTQICVMARTWVPGLGKWYGHTQASLGKASMMAPSEEMPMFRTAMRNISMWLSFLSTMEAIWL
jgi:hypothetical protein